MTDVRGDGDEWGKEKSQPVVCTDTAWRMTSLYQEAMQVETKPQETTNTHLRDPHIKVTCVIHSTVPFLLNG